MSELTNFSFVVESSLFNLLGAILIGVHQASYNLFMKIFCIPFGNLNNKIKYLHILSNEPLINQNKTFCE